MESPSYRVGKMFRNRFRSHGVRQPNTIEKNGVVHKDVHGTSQGPKMKVMGLILNILILFES
jgi:hypothetical protein